MASGDKAAYQHRERKRDDANHEVDGNGRLGIETKRVHKNWQTELSTAKPDKTAQATDRHTPAERTSEEGAVERQSGHPAMVLLSVLK
jgi:hypothetical protein